MKRTFLISALLFISMASMAQKVTVTYEYGRRDSTFTFEINRLDDLPYTTRDCVLEIPKKKDSKVRVHRDGVITTYLIKYNSGSKVYHINYRNGDHLFESTKITEIRSYLWDPIQIGLVKI